MNPVQRRGQDHGEPSSTEENSAGKRTGHPLAAERHVLWRRTWWPHTVISQKKAPQILCFTCSGDSIHYIVYSTQRTQLILKWANCFCSGSAFFYIFNSDFLSRNFYESPKEHRWISLVRTSWWMVCISVGTKFTPDGWSQTGYDCLLLRLLTACPFSGVATANHQLPACPPSLQTGYDCSSVEKTRPNSLGAGFNLKKRRIPAKV